MANIRLTGAVCAGLLAFVSTTANAQTPTMTAPVPAAGPAAVWQLRSGLNVAALACRGPGEGAIVAGYNRLLADHRAELAGVYQEVSRAYGSAAAFDAAMTRTYNTYAQPAAQAALCANVLGVLDAVTAQGTRPLAEFAGTVLLQLEDRTPPPASPVVTQVAVAVIPHLIDERPATADRGDQRTDEYEDAGAAEE